MLDLSAQQTRQASGNALKTVYYVIIGLAITEALQRTFLDNGSFVGLSVFSPKHLPTTILLFAFLPTICRFTHGASLHLDAASNSRYKPLLDFVGFFLQASLFYLMAASLEKPFAFSCFFGMMLVFDAGWILLLRSFRYISLDWTAWQWSVSDGCILVAFGILYYYDRTMGTCTTLLWILGVSLIATAVDYVMNSGFYFPTGDGDSEQVGEG